MKISHALSNLQYFTETPHPQKAERHALHAKMARFLLDNTATLTYKDCVACFPRIDA